jgi:hypothetical protein
MNKTETAEQAPGTDRVLVIGCGALARELMMVVEANGLGHVDITCLPAILHSTPDRIAPMLDEAIQRHSENYARIFVGYADCGSGGEIAKICAAHGVEMLDGPHCYSFFEGNELFATRDEATAFYLTDFLARQFESFVIKPLGLDRHPELMSIYFGNYEKLVYLAQLEDPELDEKAKQAAETLGLAFERRVTGFGDLAPAISAL